MALRIAIPGLPAEPAQERSPILEARERRLKLASYVEIDPAIRFVIALAIVAAISLLYLVQTSTVAEINYRVQRLEVERTQLVQQRQDLQLQIAEAQSLARIREVASEKLQMVPVGDGFRYLQVPAAADAAAPVVAAPEQGGSATP